MKHLILLWLLAFPTLAFAQQDEYYRIVDWKFYPDNVIGLTDSTFIMDAVPFDYNDPGAISRTVGNYVVDYIGHRYKVIDSTSTTITVLDVFRIGQAPQSSQIARCYRSVGNGEADYVGSVEYFPLDESARWKLNGSDNELLWGAMVRFSYIGAWKEPTIDRHLDGSVTIQSDGSYVFNTQEDGKGRNVLIQNITGTTLAPPDNTTSYLCVHYNNGSPYYTFETDNLQFFYDATHLPVSRVTRIGTQLHFEEPGEYGIQLANKMLYKDVAIEPFKRQSGLTLSTAATRISTVGSGVAWYAVKYYNLTQNVAGSEGLLYEYYQVGGVWLNQLVTSYDATYYSNGTNRQTLNNNKWVSKYFFRDIGDDNEAYYFHGNEYNTQNEAFLEILPPVPPTVNSHSIYVGKIVIQKNATNGIAYPRTWGEGLLIGQVNDHTALTNLGWTSSNHTSSANKIAAFDATGAATTLDTVTNLASQYDLVEKVTGAASSTDNAIAVYDGTTGKRIKNSTGTLSTDGVLTIPSYMSATNVYLSDIASTTGAFVGATASGGLSRSNVLTYSSDHIRIGNGSLGKVNIYRTSPFIGFNRAMLTGYESTSTHGSSAIFSSVGLMIATYAQSSNTIANNIWIRHNGVIYLGYNSATGRNTVDRAQVNGSIQATTAKFTNLSPSYFPVHTDDTTGLVDGNVFQTDGKMRYNTTLTTFDNDNDIPNVRWVSQIATGNMVKLPVDAATTGNITLSGTQTIDGYAAGVGSRILVWKQTTASQNGVYIVAAGAWTRATDLDTWAKLYKAYVTVQYGGQFGSSFVCTVPLSGTLETDPVTWILYLTPVNITVSSPLAKTGNNISLGYDTNTLAVASNLLKVKDNVFQPLTTVLTNTTASFTTALETKLNEIEDGAEVNVNADWDASSGDAQILNKPTLLSQFTNDLGNYGGFLTTETDPIFASDSAKILHWSDTLNLTKGIASQYDLTTGLATKQNTLTTGNLTENITGLQFDATRQVIGGAAQLSLTSGYVIPTTTEQTNWNTAYTDRNKWDGGATGLVAATGRTSLGGTTIGQSVFTSTNPSAIRFLRANADNTVSWLDAASFRTAIGAGTGGGSVTSVGMTVPTGLTVSGSPITTSGTFAISLTSGYSIPTTANQTNWTAGYNDKVNSLAFSGTTTKTLTLTQQDGGTVSNTFTDLDVQTLTADSTSTTIGLTASGSNSRVHFNVDKSATNELQNLSLGTVTTTTQPLNISNGTGVTLPAATTSTAGLLTSADKTKLDGIATGANNYTLPLAANGTRGGIQIGYTATGANLPLQLSSEKGYVALTNSAIVAGLGFTPYNATNPAGYTSNTGTVYSVAPGLGLTGGTITTSGTLSVDTASTVILSRQRAANTYQPKGTYQTGTESYISNLSLSGNTLTSTGVGSAFNSTVGNIANTSYANIFNSKQTIYANTPEFALKRNNGTNPMIIRFENYDGTQLSSITAYDDVISLNSANSGMGIDRLWVSKFGVFGNFSTRSTETKVLYYDDFTKEVVYGDAPGGVTNHSSLTALDYASSGHTGFAGTGVANTFTQDQTISVSGAVSALRIKDSEDLIFSSLNSNTGYFFVRNGHPYFLNGDFGSSEIQLDAQGTTNHAALSNLSYATSGHTDFVSTNTVQDISNYKTFTATPTIKASYFGANVIFFNDYSDSSLDMEFGTNLSASENYIWSYNMPLKFGVNSERMRIKTTGQLQFNNYTSSTAFTGTGVAALQVDASGNVITAAISGGSGTDLSFSGTSPVTLNSSTGADVTFTAGSNITLTRTSATNVTIAASSGATGDNISVNGTAAVDPNFVSTGQIGFTYTTGSPNTIKADINNGSIYAVDLAYGTAPTNGQLPAYNSSTGGFTWVSSSGSMTYPSGSGIPRVVGGSSWGTTISIPGTTNTFLRGDGTFATIPGGFTDPMTTVGDIIFRDGSNNTSRLPIGTGDYVLKSYMGTPSWQPIMSGTTTGAIPFNNGSGSLSNDGTAFTYNTSTNTLDVDIVTVDTEVYDPTGWNGDLSVPTKDAIRDKIETLQTSYDTYYVNDIITLTSGVNGYIDIYTSPSSTASTIYAIIDIHVDYGNSTYTHSSGNFSSYFTGTSIVKQNWVESYHDFLTTDVSITPEIVDNGSTSTFRIKLNTTVSSSYHYVLSIKYMHKL